MGRVTSVSVRYDTEINEPSKPLILEQKFPIIKDEAHRCKFQTLIQPRLLRSTTSCEYVTYNEYYSDRLRKKEIHKYIDYDR